MLLMVSCYPTHVALYRCMPLYIEFYAYRGSPARDVGIVRSSSVVCLMFKEGLCYVLRYTVLKNCQVSSKV